LDFGLWPNRNGRRSLGLRTPSKDVRNTADTTTDNGTTDSAVEDLLPVIRREELFVLINERHSGFIDGLLRTFS
jgi:hypothetical protein